MILLLLWANTRKLVHRPAKGKERGREATGVQWAYYVYFFWAEGYASERRGKRFKTSEDGAMIFHVTLSQAEDGWIVAECPALPGCVSQGKDDREALENIREAITAWLWAEDQKAVAGLKTEAGQKPIIVTV